MDTYESDSDDSVLGFNPNFETTSAKRPRIETTPSVTGSYVDSKQPSAKPSAVSINTHPIEIIESSDDEKETIPSNKAKAINPAALEMIAEFAVDLLMKFLVDNNDKLGIISTDKSASHSKESIRSNLMGTSESFANMPAFHDIILSLLYCANDVLYHMEDNKLDLDAFESDKEFQKDFLDDIFIYLEVFCGLFSNKRLNNHFNQTAHRYSSSTNLELVHGILEMNSEDIKRHAIRLLAGAVDADGCINHDALKSSPWKDGETKSPSQKRKNTNYKCKEKDATMQEIKDYFENHLTRQHLGAAPRIVLSACCVNGCRTSPFSIALVDQLNSGYGFPRGGLIRFSSSDDSLFEKGYLKNGNDIAFYADSTNGQGSELESAKVDFMNRLECNIIIKKAEVRNVAENFTGAKYCRGKTLSGFRQEIPEETSVERQVTEDLRRKMLVTDKELKIARKKVCEDGLVSEQVQKYIDDLQKLNDLDVIESLPKGCIHTINSLQYICGMLMGDGSITSRTVHIAQYNHSYNEALCTIIKQYIGEKVLCTSKNVWVSNCFQRTMFLLAVGLHSSHRREQVIVSLLENILFTKAATELKVDHNFLSEEITKKWKLMSKDKRTKHDANVKAWMKDECRNRKYDEGNGFVDVDEINSALKVLAKVLSKLLQVMKLKDPS